LPDGLLQRLADIGPASAAQIPALADDLGHKIIAQALDVTGQLFFAV
jgi:hypothetical protein